MRILITLFSLSLITACSTHSGDFSGDPSDELFEITEGSESVTVQSQIASVSEKTIHQHVTRLANSLFSSAKNINLDQSVAVGTFLPVSLISDESMLEQRHIGLQIQESFITLGSQAGLKIIEYKTMSSIKIQKGTDVMLSRNTQNLHSGINAQYFLTGTYSEQDDGLVVNARLIELSSQNVVAAATDYIPTVTLKSKENITMKNNLLYRNTY